MKSRVEIAIPFVDADSCTDEQLAIFEFVGFGSDMEGSLAEISEGIYVDAGVIDKSADNLNGGMHGGVVKGRPVGLETVVDVDGQMLVLLVEEVEESEGLVLEDRLQELLVDLIQLLPVVLPNRFLQTLRPLLRLVFAGSRTILQLFVDEFLFAEMMAGRTVVVGEVE